MAAPARRSRSPSRVDGGGGRSGDGLGLPGLASTSWPDDSPARGPSPGPAPVRGATPLESASQVAELADPWLVDRERPLGPGLITQDTELVEPVRVRAVGIAHVEQSEMGHVRIARTVLDRAQDRLERAGLARDLNAARFTRPRATFSPQYRWRSVTWSSGSRSDS